MAALRKVAEKTPRLPWDVPGLKTRGFKGFAPIITLQQNAFADVPKQRGIFLVAWLTQRKPNFLERSPAGKARGLDATVSVPQLAVKWIPGAVPLFLARTVDTDRGSHLRGRIEEFIEFGQGKDLELADGKFIWQIADVHDLAFAWLPTPQESPSLLLSHLLAEFKDAHRGRLPFGNLRNK